VALLIFGVASLNLSGCDIAPHPKWGFIDKSGTLVIPYRFDEVAMDNYTGFAAPNYNFFLLKPFRNFSEGLCAVSIGGKWGYIDKTGKEVVPLQYTGAGTFSEGLACVRQGDKVGYIDKTGKLVIPITLDWFPHSRKSDDDNDGEAGEDYSQEKPYLIIDCFQFSEGLAAAFSGKKCGYIDKSGKFVIPPQYEMCSQFHDGMAMVAKGMVVYRLDKTGKVLAKLAPITEFYGDGLFVHFMDFQHSEFVDKDGKKAIAKEFALAEQFSDGLAAVEPAAVPLGSERLWGYIDKTGKMVIPPKFFVGSNNFSCAFLDGRAIAAEPTGKRLCGVIDKTGNWIVQPQYRLIATYRDGLAWAIKGNEFVYIDKNGREVICPHAHWGNSFSEGLAAVMQ
jgi:hypothetical protein